uniref:Uncharacterized protein n=1 Tax=viral metagenome TaxID=1070528 RepID=A0A6C0AQ52_9ZZZZ
MVSSDTLEAIKKHNLIFVSAQPDTIYFHWQVELYLYQFSKHGPEIADRCYALFGYRDKPSLYAQELAKKFPHVICYKDTRNMSIPNFYIPSIQPHLFKQFLKEYPELGTNVFYHDSDIFLVQIPKFELLLNDPISYLSDTVSYIGYDYIQSSQKCYKTKYPELSDTSLIDTMCECIGISAEIVKENQGNSGGAQYLLKNLDADFWNETELANQKLYDTIKAYDTKFHIGNGSLQIWTAGMWAVLWNLWKQNKQTRIHKELDFSWATYTVKEYHSCNIFHLAGVTADSCKDKFYKGAYTNKNVFKEYLNNKTLFDTINPNSATFEYVKVIKEYAEGLPPIQPEKEHTRFLLDSKDAWSNVYTKDPVKTFMNKPLWRSSDNNYFIFYAGSSWVLTHSQYEKDLSSSTGGYASSTEEQPYNGSWNHECTIKILD